MSRIAMICPPAMGHIYPSLGLARELRERGHDVVFFQVAQVGRNIERITQAGFRCPVYGSPTLQKELNDAYARLGRQRSLSAFRTMIRIVERRVADTIHQLPSVLTDEQIDAAVIDRLMPGATAVAHGIPIPFASVSNALVLNRDPDVPPCFTAWLPTHRLNRLRNQIAWQFYSLSTRKILSVVNAYRRQNGLLTVDSFDANVGDALQLSQQPEFFTFERASSNPAIHFCGPFIDSGSRSKIDFPWERLTGKPLVYLSLGTLQNRTHDIYRLAAEACAPLDVDLVLSTGGVEHEFHPSLPGRPIVVRFAPQLELLEQASLCITHAGLNTTLESLSAGVPMIAIPIANDQPGVAARMEHHGFGRTLSPRRINADIMRQTIVELIDSTTIRSNVSLAKQQLDGMQGCRRAADLIERDVLERSQRRDMLLPAAS